MNVAIPTLPHMTSWREQGRPRFTQARMRRVTHPLLRPILWQTTTQPACPSGN
jgi:hypothetical protein